jgi:hypothetical protein
MNGGQPWLLCLYVVLAALVSMGSAMALARGNLRELPAQAAGLV